MKTFLFVDQRNVVGVLKALEEENLEGARIFISKELADELEETSDRVRTIKGVKEIMWENENNLMGFIDLEQSEGEWIRVYRINSDNPLFTEDMKQPPSKILCIE